MKKIYILFLFVFAIVQSSFAQVCNTAVNLALGKPGNASSVYSLSYPVAAAFDGNSGTYWSSDFSEPQFIFVDLGAQYDLCQVKFKWQNKAKDFTIDISNDAITWTTVAAVSNNPFDGIDTNVIAISGVAQYVRMNGTARVNAYGFAISEFEVYGKTPPPPACSTTNIASGKTGVASSIENGTNNVAAAFDGDKSTRWGSSYASPDPVVNADQFIYVDLGAPYDLCSVNIYWGFFYAEDYDIEISNDAVTWTTAASVTGNATYNDPSLVIFPVNTSISGNARYVRMKGIFPNSIYGSYGYSIHEFEVYGLQLLPIKLSSFKAINNDNKNVGLEWVTDQEINNKEFVVERSGDGKNFTKIATVAGAGNSSVAKKYQLIDNDAAVGINYYRLQQFDKDGKSSYSKIVSVVLDAVKGASQIYFYPNPAVSVVNIAAPKNETIVSVNFYNASGVRVKQLTGTLSANLSIPLQELSSGLYMIEVKTNKQTTVSKLIKQ